MCRPSHSSLIVRIRRKRPNAVAIHTSRYHLHLDHLNRPTHHQAIVTNITPDLVQVVAERFPRLTHLSFVWYPETDVAHGGVEITDASQILVSISFGSLCFLL